MALPRYLDEVNLDKVRTIFCERLRPGKEANPFCRWGEQCQFSHTPAWIRRPWTKYNYSYNLCPDVIVFIDDNQGHHITNNCPRGRNCRYAHSREEQWYHPYLYKTMTCDLYEANRECPRYFCPLAHGPEELHDQKEFFDFQEVFRCAYGTTSPELWLPLSYESGQALVYNGSKDTDLADSSWDTRSIKTGRHSLFGADASVRSQGFRSYHGSSRGGLGRGFPGFSGGSQRGDNMSMNTRRRGDFRGQSDDAGMGGPSRNYPEPPLAPIQEDHTGGRAKETDVAESVSQSTSKLIERRKGREGGRNRKGTPPPESGTSKDLSAESAHFSSKGESGLGFPPLFQRTDG